MERRSFVFTSYDGGSRLPWPPGSGVVSARGLLDLDVTAASAFLAGQPVAKVAGVSLTLARSAFLLFGVGHMSHLLRGYRRFYRTDVR